MLGTIRINGLEIQVRAIQKLPDYSKNRSLRRERLIEAQSWKRGKEAAITLFNPVSWGRVSRESSHKSRYSLALKEKRPKNKMLKEIYAYSPEQK